MNKNKFKKQEYIQFYIHLATLIFGGVLLVLMSQHITDFMSNNIMWILVLIVLTLFVILLTVFQVYRVTQYKQYFLNDPEVTIWKTITTLICYPIDIVFYLVVLIVLI
jgi:F0F1-type ATP synthase assembly protein I